MTARKRTRTPVSSFGPELLTALRLGCEKRTEFDFSSASLAIRFRARINALRAALRAEGHDFADASMRCSATIAEDNAHRVILAPRDSEFTDALKRLGVDVHAVEQLPKTPLGLPSEPSVETFLAGLNIVKGTEE